MDDHLAGRVLAGNVRGVFDRVVELPEPFDVFSSSPISPRAVFGLDDPLELRHLPSLAAISENSDGVKGSQNFGAVLADPLVGE